MSVVKIRVFNKYFLPVNKFKERLIHHPATNGACVLWTLVLAYLSWSLLSNNQNFKHPTRKTRHPTIFLLIRKESQWNTCPHQWKRASPIELSRTYCVSYKEIAFCAVRAHFIDALKVEIYWSALHCSLLCHLYVQCDLWVKYQAFLSPSPLVLICIDPGLRQIALRTA